MRRQHSDSGGLRLTMAMEDPAMPMGVMGVAKAIDVATCPEPALISLVSPTFHSANPARPPLVSVSHRPQEPRLHPSEAATLAAIDSIESMATTGWGGGAPG